MSSSFESRPLIWYIVDSLVRLPVQTGVQYDGEHRISAQPPIAVFPLAFRAEELLLQEVYFQVTDLLLSND